MAEMNTRQGRVIDPILSKIALGYRHQERVGHLLFPFVPVPTAGGTILEFGAEDFILYETARAEHAATKRINFGHKGKKYALVENSLEAPVSWRLMRDANLVPGIDLAGRAVKKVQSAMSLKLEAEQAALATSEESYKADHKKALSGATKWSAETGLPVADIENGKEVVRSKVGMEPNTLILSPKAWLSAKNNKSIIARFPNIDGAITLQMFKDLIEIERVVVGKSVYADTKGKRFDVWGNAAVLAYVPLEAETYEEPSYGYTYRLEGHPFVTEPYPEHTTKSWIYGVEDEREPVQCGMDAGFLITGCD